MVTRDAVAAALLRVWNDRQERQVQATPEQHCIAMADGVIALLRSISGADSKSAVRGYGWCPECGRPIDGFHVDSVEMGDVIRGLNRVLTLRTYSPCGHAVPVR